MTGRRKLLLAGLLLAGPAAAKEEAFPPTMDAAGRRLLLNGWGTRYYLGVEIYRAALYVERRHTSTAAILADPGVKLIVARYRREVPMAGVVLAWERSYEATCACSPPPGLRASMRDIAAGDVETYLFRPDGAEVAANGGPPNAIPGAEAARILLATWIGPAAPTAALRRGLLGQH